MMRVSKHTDGYTLVELVVGFVIFGIIALSFLSLFTALVSSTVTIKRKAQALAQATNQMEYLKSLPYDNLAVVGGSIYATNLLPNSKTVTVNGAKYIIKTNIEYVDDAFDGCGSYPDSQTKEKYCRNYPAPSGAPANDSNPKDYKLAHVTVVDSDNLKLADIDTHISARVAETPSTSGALFVKVIDSNGNPISDATVRVINGTVNPAADLSDTSDTNGYVIFYGLPVDSNGYDYVITASKTGFSTLSTISPSGSLQPNYISQQIFSQLSSFITLSLKPQGANSLILEATNTSGVPLSGMKVNLKGGYKKYTATSDTTYYYDNNSSPDTRPLTDSGGIATLNNLVPGNYYACGDNGAIGCNIGGTTYYLAAAISYGGSSSFSPIIVPSLDIGTSQSITFPIGSTNYLQKVRLMFTTSATLPRITSVTPYEVSSGSSNLAAVNLSMTGVNLPCSASAASCNTTVTIGGRSASCIGNSSGIQLNCIVDLTGLPQGQLGMNISANGQTLQIPASPHLGALNVAL